MTPEEQDAAIRQITEAMSAQVNDAIGNPLIALHNIYEQMVDAGFTRYEACTIIGVWMGYQGSIAS